MNKSKYINPENCKKCGGKCCKSFSIIYQKELEEIDANMFSEVKRFKFLDTDKIEVHEYDDYFEVLFKFPCIFLNKNNSCGIYNSDRPLLYQEFPYDDTTKLDCPFKEVTMADEIVGLVGDYNWKQVRDVFVIELIKCENEIDFIELMQKMFLGIGTKEQLTERRKELKIHDFTDKDKKLMKKLRMK
jgi:Fe-S-cluster containining protein